MNISKTKGKHNSEDTQSVITYSFYCHSSNVLKVASGSFVLLVLILICTQCMKVRRSLTRGGEAYTYQRSVYHSIPDVANT